MRGSQKIFTWLGIPVYLHTTFFLIPLLLVGVALFQNLSLTDIIFFATAIFFLFASVLLHEYGHALMARRYGVQTRDIILTPIGGIARLEQMPENPLQEFFVAIAGPLVNVVIAIVLLLACKFVVFADPLNWEIFKLYITGLMSSGTDNVELANLIEESGIVVPAWKPMFPQVLVINVMLVLFNLIPAFPMDGGRVLRALLSMKIGRVRATQMAAWIGQGIAVLFIAMGIFVGPITLGLVGFFVFTTARTENNMVRLDDVLRNHKVAEIIRTQFTGLNANDWMQTPIHLLQKGLERHFLVKNMQEHYFGILTETNILAAARKGSLSTDVSQYTIAPFEAVQANDSLLDVYQIIFLRGKGIVPVMENDVVIGVVDEAGLEYFLKMHIPPKRFPL